MGCCNFPIHNIQCDPRSNSERLRDDLIWAEKATGIPYDKFMNYAHLVEHGQYSIMGLGPNVQARGPKGRKFNVVFRLDRFRCVLMNTLDYDYAEMASYDDSLQSAIDEAYAEWDKEQRRNQLRAVGINPEW